MERFINNNSPGVIFLSMQDVRGGNTTQFRGEYVKYYLIPIECYKNREYADFIMHIDISLSIDGKICYY